MADQPGQSSQAAGSGPAVVIVKKKKGGDEHPHHGGAWKVAYADFVTAMMAFFLLLWLLSNTTPIQKQGIAHYFNPPNNSTEYGGGSGIMSGMSTIEADQHAAIAQPDIRQEQKESEDLAIQSREDELFQQIAQQVKQAVVNLPQLQMMLKNLVVEVTPEGLRIQLVDSADRPLFNAGTAQMYDYTKQMLAVVSSVLQKLPNGIAVGGHTDSVPYRALNPGSADYTNWELSADRAQAARRVMEKEGIPDKRIARVAGYAAQEPLLKDAPQDPKNGRISLIVLRSRKGSVAQFSSDGFTPPPGGVVVP
ncbi:MAG TPA: flagellar motor protein MotB [Alphaproteobacteria bacterium]|nr:flagellar motor protein MotB [Alphaproteobacteria bacterium]